MTQRTDKIYDKIFKRMLSLSTRLVIALINSLFNTQYAPDSKLTYNLTENVDSQLNRTLADTIITVNNIHSYHMEAQIYQDDNIIFRMFDYGYHHALRTTASQKDRIIFPEPAIIYLAEGKPLPDTYTLDVVFGQQGIFTYTVPVCIFISLTPEEIEKKNMVMLLPFYILKLRRTMKENRSPQTLEQLKKLIFDDILGIINRQLAAGLLTINDATILRELLLRLYNHLYADYKECKEGGINTMMEDEFILQTDIITYEVTKRVTEEVTEEVTEKLTAEYEQKLSEKDKIIQAYKLLARNVPIEQISINTGLSEDEIRNL